MPQGLHFKKKYIVSTALIQLHEPARWLCLQYFSATQGYGIGPFPRPTAWLNGNLILINVSATAVWNMPVICNIYLPFCQPLELSVVVWVLSLPTIWKIYWIGRLYFQEIHHSPSPQRSILGTPILSSGCWTRGSHFLTWRTNSDTYSIPAHSTTHSPLQSSPFPSVSRERQDRKWVTW